MSGLGSLEPQNKQEPPLFVGVLRDAVKSPLIVTLPPFLIQFGDFLPRRAAYCWQNNGRKDTTVASG